MATNGMLSAADVRCLLKHQCEAAGSQANWAREHRISAAYLNDVLEGRRGIGPAIMRRMGLQKVVMYRRDGEGK